MTSDATVAPGGRRGPGADRVFVWVWLPGAVEPVVAGVLARARGLLQGEPVLAFRYASSYRARPDAISIFAPELPLSEAVFDPRRVPRREPLALAGCLRDAAPDAWGRRVLNLRLAGNPDTELSEIAYLLGSGSNRIGALDFQEAPDRYAPRDHGATLEQLLQVAELVEAGVPLPPELAAAAAHGTSIGGARPKALLTDGGRQLIAKFSSSTDTRPVVKAEAVAMLLAARAGLSVAAVQTHRVAGKDVLLVERFDRARTTGGPSGAARTRRLMVSMLTVLGVSEMNSRYSSYAQLAETIRTGPWSRVPGTLRELYSRLVFSVCVGNNDDHLRNHAAFWNGRLLELTPAYDLAPQVRSTNTSSQAIGITRNGDNASQLRLCRAVAPEFLLTPAEADAIIDHIVMTIRDQWDDACDEAGLTRTERAALMGREFLNPSITYPEP